MSKKNYKNEFFDILSDILFNNKVQEMKNYRQHCDVSCYKHCIKVAYYTFIVCKKLNLDYKSATRGAMLHDLFLYDWRDKKVTSSLPKLHAFIHPTIAYKNAIKLFNLNNIEKDIIIKHMWPVTLKLPKYSESFIVTTMDKYSACIETFEYLYKIMKRKTIYRYAYIFLSMLIFRII